MAFGSASVLLHGEAGMRNRRRAMLYISNGYDFERGRSLSALFSRAAHQAQVKVFAVNAGALAVKPMNDPRVDPNFWKQVVASRRQTLRAIAEATGGSAFLDDVDVAGAASRLRAAVLNVQ